MTPPGRAIVELAARERGPFFVVATAAVGATAISLARGDNRVWAFLVVLAIALAAVAVADVDAGFSTPVLWGLSLFACAHLAGGLLPSPTGAVTFYETWLLPGVVKYDQAVHFTGSVLATTLAWQVLGRHLDPRRTSATVQAQLAAAVGLGKGALNEVIEFLASLGGQNVIIGDGANTGWDLVFNLAGVAAAAAWLAGSGARRRTDQPMRSSTPRQRARVRSSRPTAPAAGTDAAAATASSADPSVTIA